MDDNGIMEQIRGWLSQGLSAPEIIHKGYASSTVYRVQRDVRRKVRALGLSLPGNGISPPGLDYWGKLEAENRRLNQRIESLESQLAEVISEVDASPSPEGVEEIRQTLEEVVTRLEQMRRDVAAVQAKTGKIDGELDDLAKLYQDDLLFGVGDPKWRRRP